MDIEVTEPSGFNEYKQLAPLAVKPYGGKYLVRGGLNGTPEGDWCTQCLVILEFDSSGRAKEWLNSPTYAQARAVRHKYAKSRMIVVEGVKKNV